jgi:hypothetical protein
MVAVEQLEGGCWTYMAEIHKIPFRAFISYSHANTSWAKWLHNQLERFRIDKDLIGLKTSTAVIPKALRPIFRDRDDFTAGHTLTEQTLAALDGSGALIVLCSPQSAASRYVNEEIRLYKWRHPDRPIIPVIVDGTPGDSAQECFASALKFEVTGDGTLTELPMEAGRGCPRPGRWPQFGFGQNCCSSAGPPNG